MRMMGESLSPRVQDTEEADLRTQMFRISGDGLERFRGSPEQQTVHLAFVLESQRREWFGQGEDHMEVVARQQLCLALFQPAGSRHSLTLWAVPIRAGVVGVAFMAALVTSFEMASQCRRPAGFDGAQNAPLCRRQRGGMRLAKLVAMGAHDVRDFE
jgi:hypothetical protein